MDKTISTDAAASFPISKYRLSDQHIDSVTAGHDNVYACLLRARAIAQAVNGCTDGCQEMPAESIPIALQAIELEIEDAIAVLDAWLEQIQGGAS